MQYVYKQNDLGNTIEIDTGDIIIPELIENKHLLSFEAKTYTKLNKGIPLFLSVNNFFDYISEHDRKIILIYMADMHLQIQESIAGGNISNVVALSNNLGKKVLLLNNTIQLYSKLVAFVDSSVEIDIPAYAGTRAQDTGAKTYLYEDVVKLVACIVLSKILAPIFSEIMYYCTLFGVSTKIKETHCLPILLPFYDNACPDVINKLKGYIKGVVKSQRFKESIDSINMGFTNNTILDHALITLVVRNFVNMDMFTERGNYVTAIMVNIKKSVSSQETVNTNKVNIRKDITNEPDERKRSSLEIDSIVSHNTADVPAIAEAFIDRVVTQHLKEHNIDREQYNECYKYNLNKQTSYNILNRLLVEMLFSQDLGGVVCLRYIRIKPMTKLITVVQLLCMRLNYQELAHGITAKDTCMIKSSMSNQDQNILINYTNMPVYKSYLDKLSNSPIGPQMAIMFGDIVKNIVNVITSSTFTFQSANCIWDIVDTEGMNGKPIQFTEAYITDLCNFLCWVEPYD